MSVLLQRPRKSKKIIQNPQIVFVKSTNTPKYAKKPTNTHGREEMAQVSYIKMTLLLPGPRKSKKNHTKSTNRICKIRKHTQIHQKTHKYTWSRGDWPKCHISKWPSCYPDLGNPKKIQLVFVKSTNTTKYTIVDPFLDDPQRCMENEYWPDCTEQQLFFYLLNCQSPT
jgi:hypothetical protein